ncbi:MAG: AraC family transcriptional regulator, partial [Clostridia bacterium]|nr:AraC family transcriptional regulator [Clostridia bacterium]
MQNRPFEDISVSYSEIDFPEDFPIAFTRHVQRYQSGGALHFHNGIEIGICHEGTGLFFIDNR